MHNALVIVVCYLFIASVLGWVDTVWPDKLKPGTSTEEITEKGIALGIIRFLALIACGIVLLVYLVG